MFDIPISCYIDDGRRSNPATGTQYTTARELWEKAPKAAARKATASGVNNICINVKEGRFHIFQIGGYTKDRGLFCDILNEAGQIIATY